MIIMLAFACSLGPGGYVLLPGPPYVISISGNGVDEVLEVGSDTDPDTGSTPRGAGIDGTVVWNLSGTGCTQNIWPRLVYNPAFPLPTLGSSLPVNDLGIHLHTEAVPAADTDTDTDIDTTITPGRRWLRLEGASVETISIERGHWVFSVDSASLCTPEDVCTDDPDPLMVDITGPQIDMHERLETGTPGYYWEVVPSPTWFDPDGVPYCALTYFTP